jgi:hypothetical protein
MGPKGEPDTKTNWSTDCRPQDELQLHFLEIRCNIIPSRPTSSSRLFPLVFQIGVLYGHLN